MTETRRKIARKERTKEGKTYRLSVGRERIAHDIRVTGHDTFSSKAIRAIGIDHPRDMLMINGLTGSKSPLLQFPILGAMIKKGEKEDEQEFKHIPEW